MSGRCDDLVDELEQLMRTRVLASMPHDPTGELADQSLADLLIAYGTWLARLVPKRPREVHRAVELMASGKADEHAAVLGALVEKIERGDDLMAQLSRTVEVAYEAGADAAGKPLARRQDRDLLIADWGIHHLHLSTTVAQHGFVERTADLLFAAFALDHAYLIGIYPHGSWALKELVEVVVRNWPDVGIVHEMKGIVGLTHEYTDDERLQLRKSGITGPVEVDGKVYMTSGRRWPERR